MNTMNSVMNELQQMIDESIEEGREVHTVDFSDEPYVNKTLRHPDLWSEKEINKLVLQEVGVDILFPRGFEILVKLWMPPEEDGSGIASTDHSRRNERITTRVGRILRIGPEAFRDPNRFPAGPRASYNEWIIFRSMERDLIRVNDHYLAHIHDDRIRMMVTHPELVQTTFDLEYEHNG